MSPTGSTQTDATSAAIQAILALGENPRSWKGAVKGNPYTALNALLQTNGSYRQTDRLGLIGHHELGADRAGREVSDLLDLPEEDRPRP